MSFRRQSLILGVKPNLRDSLIAWYDLEEAAGATRKDATGRGNTLTDNNTVGQVAGKVGNAGGFVSASIQYLSAASNSDLTTGNISFTWAMWVYATTLASFPYMLSKATGNGDAVNEYEMYIDTTQGNKPNFGVGNGTTAKDVLATSFGALPLTTWTFVVGWYDAAAATANIAVNGGPTDSLASASGYSNASTMRLGNSGAINHPWNGRLDSVGFWKRALTSAERTWLYNGGAGRQYSDL